MNMKHYISIIRETIDILCKTLDLNKNYQQASGFIRASENQ